MRQHHTKVHGTPLPNRTCGECDEMFYDPKARRVYCDDCYTGAGEQNGNWQNAAETTDCRRCDTEFEYYPSNKDGVFCFDCVERMDEFIGTPLHEIRDICHREFDCEHCGTSFELLRSEAERDSRRGRFCSHQCRSEWISENWTGENHHQWLEGKVEYAGKWWDVREQALNRGDYECQNCGMTREERGRNPDVHHVVPIRECDDPQAAHYLSNVICLCRSCHRKVEAGTVPCPDF